MGTQIRKGKLFFIIFFKIRITFGIFFLKYMFIRIDYF